MNNNKISSSKLAVITIIVITLTILIYFVLGARTLSSLNPVSAVVASATGASSPDNSRTEVASVSASANAANATLVPDTTSLPASILSTSTAVEASSSLITKVTYALLVPPDKEGDHKLMRGCDLIGFKEVKVAATSSAIDAAMKALFARKESWPAADSKGGNFITSQKQLAFDSAVIEGNTAKVYLLGTPKLDGICDDHRIGLQVGETALKIPSITNVEIYINGELLTIATPHVE